MLSLHCQIMKKREARGQGSGWIAGRERLLAPGVNQRINQKMFDLGWGKRFGRHSGESPRAFRSDPRHNPILAGESPYARWACAERSQTERPVFSLSSPPVSSNGLGLTFP